MSKSTGYSNFKYSRLFFFFIFPSHQETQTIATMSSNEYTLAYFLTISFKQGAIYYATSKTVLRLAPLAKK